MKFSWPCEDKILIKSIEFYTEKNSLKNSCTMKKCTAPIGKKKAQINYLQFTFLTGISDNYIIIKTAPNRHTDHASERETYKRHTFSPTKEYIQPNAFRPTHTQAHSLTHLKISHSFLPPAHSDIGLSCKHWQAVCHLTILWIVFKSYQIVLFFKKLYWTGIHDRVDLILSDQTSEM